MESVSNTKAGAERPASEEATSGLEARQTRDILRYFVRETPGAHERLRAYVEDLMSGDASLGGNDKLRSRILNDAAMAMVKVAQTEAARLMEVSSANNGRVPAEEILRSRQALAAEYDRIKKFRLKAAA